MFYVGDPGQYSYYNVPHEVERPAIEKGTSEGNKDEARLQAVCFALRPAILRLCDSCGAIHMIPGRRLVGHVNSPRGTMELPAGSS